MITWKLLKSLLLISGICVIGNASCSTKINYKDESLPEFSYTHELQEAIDQVLLSYPDYDLGISTAVIVPGHKTWTGASGYSHQHVPITADMLFGVGSIQKNFEVALVLKLSEDDILNLDDPISKYLPDYSNVDG
jgi:CubicO group peptidase (beta-lactamase class C family)